MYCDNLKTTDQKVIKVNLFRQLFALAFQNIFNITAPKERRSELASKALAQNSYVQNDMSSKYFQTENDCTIKLLLLRALKERFHFETPLFHHSSFKVL